MRNVLFSGLFTIFALIEQGCGATTGSLARRVDGDVNATAATLVEFRQRVERYMDLREDVVDEVGEAAVTSDPAVIWAREQALAARIRARRANAKHGDIFTPETRTLFRRLLRPELKGEQGEDIRAKLQDDAPAPGAVPLEVNATYPAGLPYPTTPAVVLAVLPVLPTGLQYRIIGKDLILLDQPADVILDYVRNVVP